MFFQSARRDHSVRSPRVALRLLLFTALGLGSFRLLFHSELHDSTDQCVRNGLIEGELEVSLLTLIGGNCRPSVSHRPSPGGKIRCGS